MKLLIGAPFDQWRVTSGPVIEHFGGIGNELCGVFNVRHATQGALAVIAAVGEGWDHVSVSLPKRCPTWGEMQYVKRAFFKENEWALEYHPPADENVSVHEFCLHLWRPHNVDFPKPPTYMIG